MADYIEMEPGSLTRLLMEAKSGDPQVQEKLYERFKPMIQNMAHKMDWADWEDAQQELICELFLAADRFEPPTDYQISDF